MTKLIVIVCVCRHRGQCLCGVCVCLLRGHRRSLSGECVFIPPLWAAQGSCICKTQRWNQSDFTVHCRLGKQMNARRGEVEDGVLEGQGGVCWLTPSNRQHPGLIRVAPPAGATKEISWSDRANSHPRHYREFAQAGQTRRAENGTC